jgi:hypothetical protein
MSSGSSPRQRLLGPGTNDSTIWNHLGSFKLVHVLPVIQWRAAAVEEG